MDLLSNFAPLRAKSDILCDMIISLWESVGSSFFSCKSTSPNKFTVASIGGAVNGSAGESKKATKRGAGGGKKAGAAAAKADFKCDMAKSSRSTCRGCHETIIKVQWH